MFRWVLVSGSAAGDERGDAGPGRAREELIVTVSGADGVLTELTVTPDWVRVGGSAECGGPTEAEVVVPAP